MKDMTDVCPDHVDDVVVTTRFEKGKIRLSREATNNFPAKHVTIWGMKNSFFPED